MAEDTKTAIPDSPCPPAQQVPLPHNPSQLQPQPEPEPEPAILDNDAPPQPDPVKPAPEPDQENPKDDDPTQDTKITESASFKEESNKVDDLIDPEKKALDEFKQLIKVALHNHQFTAPPKEDEPKADDKKPETEEAQPPEENKPEEEREENENKNENQDQEKPKAESSQVPPPVKEEETPAGKQVEEPAVASPAAEPSETVVEKIEDKSEAVEEIKETIVHEVTAPTPPPCEEPAPIPEAEQEKPKEEEEEKAAAPPAEPEEVSIWGIPLLADERTDVILLKFLRARDFKVGAAFAMLKSVVAWRKSFKIDELLEEQGLGEGLEKVVYSHGVDKEGHPVCYNAFGEFHDKELYSNTFADAEKRAKFLRFYIQFLEKNIRKLDFSPDGVCTIVQITDLQNSPGLILFKKELRQGTNQALQLLQDNYPEFAAKQVFINVPWWYVAYNRMISPFLTQRTKSKFVFAGPTRTAETLFKYIAPEQVPVQYGGLSKEGDSEFTFADAVTEEIIKPATKHTIEVPITEACTMVWEVRVVGWDVSYGAEFDPSAEGKYTWIIQKPRKVGPTDEQVISCSFKIGETGKVVLTFDNQTSKKKKLLYRSKAKSYE